MGCNRPAIPSKSGGQSQRDCRFAGSWVVQDFIAADVQPAQALGADLAYIGTRFIASEEANAPAEYKQMIIDSRAEDIVYTSLFTGVHGNYLKGSIVNAGLDPDNLPESDKTKMDFGTGSAKAKAWRDIWGAGQGVGQVEAAPPAAKIVERLAAEYPTSRIRAVVA